MDQFLRRKNQQFLKEDRSIKQSWDNRILKLCEKINKSENYYTTSSCSGRVLILINDEQKKDDLFLYCSHDLLSFKEIKEEIEKIKIKTNNLVYFKQDPVILHIACRNLEYAQKIHDLAKESGWKKCGIISTNNRYIVEISGTDKLEFPLINKGKLLVDDEMVKLIVEESNRKFQRSWEKIEKLEKSITI